MVQFECPMVIHPLVSFTFGVHCGASLSLHARKGKCCMWLVNKVDTYSACKNRFCRLQMVQFECPKVMHPLMSSPFGVHCGVPFSLHIGKGKSCIRPVKKLEIHFAKIGFVDCKWSNLNAPGSYTPCCHPLLGSTVGCPFLCMQEKGNTACCLLIK